MNSKCSFDLPSEPPAQNTLHQKLSTLGFFCWQYTFDNGTPHLHFSADLLLFLGHPTTHFCISSSAIASVVHPNDWQLILAELSQPAQPNNIQITCRMWHHPSCQWVAMVMTGSVDEPNANNAQSNALTISGLVQQDPQTAKGTSVEANPLATRESEEIAALITNTLPYCFIVWDNTLEVMSCSPATATMLGYKSPLDVLENAANIHPVLQPHGAVSKGLFGQKLHAALNGNAETFEWTLQKADGTPIHTLISLTSLQPGKEPIIACQVSDLTFIKSKESKNDKERQNLRMILNSSPVCFMALVGNTVRYTTPYASYFLGIDEGDSLTDFYSHPKEREDFFAELNYTGAVNWRVITVKSADGSPKEMLVNAFLAYYYGERCVMAWLLDVTEIQEKKKELQRAKDLAQQSAQSKSDFLANMSHEIRTPMNAILGLLRLVLETDLTEYQRKYLDKADYSAKNLLRILNDILDFSKIEAGKLEVESTTFCLPDMLHNTVDILRESAQQKQIDLSLTIDRNCPSDVVGDPLRLSQVLTNLVGNALKFTANGEVTITTRQIAQENNISLLSFTVQDTGIGMTQDHVGKLFAPFSQADSSTTRKFGGTGLGLAISKKLVELMGGTLSCTSELTKGSCFTFTLPLPIINSHSCTPYALEHAVQKPEELVAHLHGKHILVAEDNDINQIIAQEVLEKAGFVVEIAENGKIAIEKIMANHYDLVFMDIQMPEIDGLEATAQIRKIPRLHHLPIIAMTAHAMVGDKDKSIEAGMNDHITKPLNPFDLFSTIAKWLDQTTTHQEKTISEVVAAGLRHTPKPTIVSSETITDHVTTTYGRNKIPVAINMQTGLRNSPDATSYYNLLKYKATIAPQTLEDVSRALLLGDAEALSAALEIVYSSAAFIGAEEIAAIAQKMSQVSLLQNYPLMLSLYNSLERAIKHFIVSANSLPPVNNL